MCPVLSSHLLCIAKDDFDLNHLPSPLMCCDYRCAPAHISYMVLGIESRSLYLLDEHSTY